MNIPVLAKIGRNARFILGRSALKLQNASPHILVIIGTGGIVFAGVKACMATLKLEDTIDAGRDKIIDIKIRHNEESDGVVYDKKYHDNLNRAKMEAALNIAKLYAFPVALGAVSIGCIAGGHVILTRRCAAAMATCQMLQETVDKYREFINNNQADLLPEGSDEPSVCETNDDTELNKKSSSPDTTSIYSVIFDQMSQRFDETSWEYNLAFLRRAQSYFNDLLIVRGHVFLNEVYDYLDVPRTKAGQVVGWYRNPNDPSRDNFISFGIDMAQDKMTYKFVNGQCADDMGVLLDFNVDGVILDLIDREKTRFDNLKQRRIG